jgi:hypothetical protein
MKEFPNVKINTEQTRNFNGFMANTKTQAIGSVEGIVKFHNNDYPCSFYVIKGLPYSAFIGGDFGDRYESCIDRGIRSITYCINNKKESVRIYSKVDKKIRVFQDVILQPGEETTIKINPVLHSK